MQKAAHSQGLKLKELFMPLLIAILLGSAIIARVWVHHQIITLAYQKSDLKSHISHLKSHKADLELEIAALKTPKKLITAAEMVHQQHPPRSDQIIKVSQNKQR